jgi:hypothetical protein
VIAGDEVAEAVCCVPRHWPGGPRGWPGGPRGWPGGLPSSPGTGPVTTLGLAR